ncbi:aminodeoxychorismate/anthranilate synthase component II [Pigmentibacter sp. JX0631]|uniref:aminodeoxychorismate/anthranilate synthase component II n=1 Tax=Pigmentibacter sp. JX0631 TaxID=2976982 RepID=UPI002469A47B|nr:aminodeoxychorismate/anthranilate synthase component II [Pigmentibacter sp. JX0631]WGL58726.1 aminodeoxychorismate/anthranilate synthase component II [Pigmentibacter sp. JX0631]
MILFIDHHDSFSNNLISWFQAKDLAMKVLSYSELSENIELNNIKALIFSPGPGHPQDYPLSLTLLKHLPKQVPFLGVCLGHQLLLHEQGGKIEQVHQTPVHGRQIKSKPIHSSRYFSPSDLAGIFVLYNSLGCKFKDPIFMQSMIALAVEDSFVLATEHIVYPRIGLQFHPESFASPGGNNVLLSFLRLIKC